ncbi:uncharacterized protein LOC144918233 [Branchiostoma floridae x Branchiostoma belcheri]
MPGRVFSGEVLTDHGTAEYPMYVQTLLMIVTDSAAIYSDCEDTPTLNASVNSSTITSPGYPNRYSNNLRCSWTITVSRGRRAAIRFTGLDIEVQCSPTFCITDIGINL